MALGGAQSASDSLWGLECVLDVEEAESCSRELSSVTVEVCVNTHCECMFIERGPLM